MSTASRSVVAGLALAVLASGPFAADVRADAAAWEAATRDARTAFERGRYAEAGEAFGRAAELAGDFPADD